MISTFRRPAIALIIVALLSIFSAPEASAQYNRGDKAFGVRAGFESRNTSAVAGVSFEYTLSRHLRLAPEIDLIFRHKNQDAGAFALNVDFPLQLGNDRSAFFPLAGIVYRSWATHKKNINDKDNTTRRNALGLNLGAGFETKLSHTCKFSVEAVYTLQRHYPGIEILAGISFIF